MGFKGMQKIPEEIQSKNAVKQLQQKRQKPKKELLKDEIF